MIEGAFHGGEESKLSRNTPEEKGRVSRYYPLTNRARLAEYCQALVYPKHLARCRGWSYRFPARRVRRFDHMQLLQNPQYNQIQFKPNWYRGYPPYHI